ncbi:MULTISPECIES: TetR/AcrR family transcriptional regulator [unclassified Pseudomonas]|uniref:TetR/AcrR family transcriptional regulator n=1 Tax=unclassified Pseudomonas TaxID=196821 RepID=UPI00027228FE|nr:MULTISPECIES: TetR/AcrR family transcriptional regulator [unclassified Pseudomonas]EJM21075.1 transcriptional regulator [Pseudomonas sp. GM21]MBV7477611.1 TetR/AcrR family transcriptional regulator [Pseudomonas sp. PDM31]
MPTAIKNSRSQEERNAIAKAKLCEAALELFALRGYDSTSLADIGVRAGYSRSLAQYHFANKTQLGELLLEDMGNRDLQAHVLKLPDDADGQLAWQQLECHLDESWQNYRSMLDGSDSNLAARGEMILCVTAIFSSDSALREKLKAVSQVLIQRVRHALQLCIRDGVIRADVDASSVATFYTSSIWGLVNTLFAEPDSKEHLNEAVQTLKNFMNTLRQHSPAPPGQSHEKREL